MSFRTHWCGWIHYLCVAGMTLPLLACAGSGAATQAASADGTVLMAPLKIPMPLDKAGFKVDVTFDVPIERSTWVALRQFPQLHTNPVDVIVDEQPIRVSRASARWCEESVEQLWRDRNLFIAPHERDAARAAYDRASEDYRKRAAEAPEGS